MPDASRLDRLERRCRYLTAAVVALAALLVVERVGGAAAHPKHIHASGLTITGSEGHNVFHLGTSTDGDGQLKMYDRRGDPRIVIAAKREYGVISFVDSDMELAGCIFGDDCTETLKPAERVDAK